MAHSGGLQSQLLDVRHATRRDEDLVGHQRAVLATVPVPDDLACRAVLHGGDPGAEDQAHPVPEQRLPDDLAAVRVVARQELRGVARERDLRPEPSERLRQLAAHRAAAQHREVARSLGELEHGLAGEEARFDEPRDGRVPGSRAGGDDGAREAEGRPSTARRVGPVNVAWPRKTSTPSPG